MSRGEAIVRARLLIYATSRGRDKNMMLPLIAFVCLSPSLALSQGAKGARRASDSRKHN